MTDLFVRELTTMQLIRKTIRDRGEPADWRRMIHGRAPPMPYWQASRAMQNTCPICMQPTFHKGSHKPGDGMARNNVAWHQNCLGLYNVWTHSIQAANWLSNRQKGLCAISGEPIGYRYDVDHIEPLWKVALNREAQTWPEVLRFWGPRNLQLVTRVAHQEKTAREAGERASHDKVGVGGVDGVSCGGREAAE